MSQIHPVQSLLDEHILIEAVLEAFEAKLQRLPGVVFPAPWLADALDFFTNFVEGCHHNREEELVFPHLREAGLLQEHDAGTASVKKLQASMEAAGRGDPQAIENLRREGLDYVQFLRDHISREDELLHRVASQPATEQEILRLQEGAAPEQFHRMDQETYERYVALADALSAAPVA